MKGIYAVVKEVEGRIIRLEQDVEFESDLEDFRMKFVRRIKVNGQLLHEKNWDEVFPRDFQ